MNEKNDNLLLYIFAAFIVICILSLVITFFTFKKATNTQQVNTNQVIIDNAVQQAQQNTVIQENPVISQFPTEQPVNTVNITPEASPSLDSETTQKIEDKFMEARNFIQNKDFVKAENIFNDIANENKGTVWEEQAKMAIENLNKITSAESNAGKNVTFGYLRLINTCIQSHMVETSTFPEINNLENSKEFFENKCGFNDKNFFSNDLRNIVFENTSLDYKLIFELNSGKKYSVSSKGIFEE